LKSDFRFEDLLSGWLEVANEVWVRGSITNEQCLLAYTNRVWWHGARRRGQGKRDVDGRSSFVGTNLKTAAEFPHTCYSHARFWSRRIQAAESFFVHTFAIVSNFQLE